MLVNFFDLGAYGGLESEFILGMCRRACWNCMVHIFEPAQDAFAMVQRRFAGQPNVRAFKQALAAKPGQCKLFHASPDNPFGHSIYGSKSNVSLSDFEVVEAIQLSDYLATVDTLDNAINVLKLNIEGAEWAVFDDLEYSGFITDFKVFCGSIDDVLKVDEVCNRWSDLESILKRHHISILPFSAQGYPEERTRVEAEVEGIEQAIRRTICAVGGS